jgi:hypothetical protein
MKCKSPAPKYRSGLFPHGNKLAIWESLRGNGAHCAVVMERKPIRVGGVAAPS